MFNTLCKFSHIFMLFLTIALPCQALGATKAAAVIEDGYAGKVLQKIMADSKAKITEPVDIRLYLDDQGKLTDCRKIRGGDATGICAAARAASPFGQPPYEVAASMVISFWSGDKAAPPKKESTSQAAPAQADSAYLSKITREIRNSIYIPQETKKGSYHATVKLDIDKNGHLANSEIVKSSGDSRLDKYVLQGVARKGSVTPPPASLRNPVQLTFTLTRS